MVLTPSGEVLTNNHVVQGATRISVTDIGNGRTYSASVVGYDRTSDVAVLQLQGASGLQTVPLGDSSTVSVGARVVALGNAGGRGGPPMSPPASSPRSIRRSPRADMGGANAQRLTGLIETNAAIRPGDSGGPLVNDAGQVIGMDAAASAQLRRPAFRHPGVRDTDRRRARDRQADRGRACRRRPCTSGRPRFLGVQVVPPAQLRGGFGGGSASSGSGPSWAECSRGIRRRKPGWRRAT